MARKRKIWLTPDQTLNGGDGSNLGYITNPIDKVDTGTRASSEDKLVTQMDGAVAKGTERIQNQNEAAMQKSAESVIPDNLNVAKIGGYEDSTPAPAVVAANDTPDYSAQAKAAAQQYVKQSGVQQPTDKTEPAPVFSSKELADMYDQRNKEVQDEYERKNYRAKLFEGLYKGLSALTQLPGAIGNGNSALATSEGAWKDLQGDLADRLKRSREDNRLWYERQTKNAMDDFNRQLRLRESEANEKYKTAQTEYYKAMAGKNESQAGKYEADAERVRILTEADQKVKEAQAALNNAKSDKERAAAYKSYQDAISNREKAISTVTKNEADAGAAEALEWRRYNQPFSSSSSTPSYATATQPQTPSTPASGSKVPPSRQNQSTNSKTPPSRRKNK